MSLRERIVLCDDDNIDDWRKRCPNGLHFVVGDTHGERATLEALMGKIKFDPGKDHVYFAGDYNEGGDVRSLLGYMATYYQADFHRPGFHLIRGNHERELGPLYALENLPDIVVLREQYRTYYIAHAGMIAPVFDAINDDMAKCPQQSVFAYKFDDICVQFNGPFRQVVWSRNGLYSQKTHWGAWPREASLMKSRACIIHGHSPYCFFKTEDNISYGDQNLYWQKQHIFFAEDLQSFNIDSNIKGRCVNGEYYRGLSCVCLESIEDIAAQNGGNLTVDGIKNARNFVFSSEHVYGLPVGGCGEIDTITHAAPEMKLITMDTRELPWIVG